MIALALALACAQFPTTANGASPGTAKMAAGGDETCELTATGALRCWGSDKEGFVAKAPSGTFIDVDVEDGLGCALRESGSPICWGRDDYGQQSGIKVESFKDIKTDWSFACGQRADNSLSCWGSSLDDRSSAPAGKFSNFDINYAYGCAVRATDQGITCWGDGGAARVTDAPTVGRYKAVATGDYHACALAVDDTVTCWGDTALDSPAGRWSGLVSGFDYSCALDGGGIPHCWGKDSAKVSTPPSASFTELAAGDYHLCGRTSAGDMLCWGSDDEGQLSGASSSGPAGPATTTGATGSLAWLTGSWHGVDDEGWTYDFTVEADGRYVRVIHQGDSTSCKQSGVLSVTSSSLTTDFTVNECNRDYEGRSDTNGLTDLSSDAFELQMSGYAVHYSRGGSGSALAPTAPAGDTWLAGAWAGVDPEGWTYDLSVNGDDTFTATVTQDGGAQCTQAGTKRAVDGAMVTTYSANSCAPSYVGQTTENPILNVSETGFSQDMGDYRVVYRRLGPAPGAASVMTGSSQGLVAGGNLTCAVSGGAVACWGSDKQGANRPPAVSLVQADVEDGLGCGLTATGAVVCWGRNDYDQLAVPSGRFARVKTDWSFACAQGTDGNLSCWGSDLGDRSTPVTGAVTDFDVNYAYGCALRPNGSLACWGADDYGQASPPTGAFTSISTGDYHACAIQSSGQGSCWGKGDKGATTVPSGTWSQLEAGFSNTCGLTSTGQVKCWGEDDHGQSSAPSGSFTDLTVGDYHSCAKSTSGAWTCWGRNDEGQLNIP